MNDEAASTRSMGLSPELQRYTVEHSSGGIDPIASELARTTREHFGDRAGMNIDQDQGRLLEWLARSLDASLIVEVGTFTGMSALWLARGLAPGGHLICHDIEERYISVGRPFWEQAQVSDRITVRIGPAAETLVELEGSTVDLAFIDADKAGYSTYLELVLPHLRRGGVIAVDNVLWSGRVLDDGDTSTDTVALRAFNDAVTARADLDVVMLGIGDGVTLIRKT